MQKHLPFWIITIAVFFALILPTLLRDGMFMDGLLYASVAHNLSEGIGTFWFPHFSKTLHSFFDQQPPLGFGIQSIFYSLFGSSFYVERGYSLLTALLNAALIVLLWRHVFKENAELKRLSWLPLLFWITIPVCFWAYSNNVMENTMSVFDLAAVWLVFRYTKSFSVFNLIAGGIFILMAFLTKGIQGIFPIVFIAAAWFILKNFSIKKMFGGTAVLVIVPGLLLLLILQNDSAYESLNAYLNNRVLNSIQHVDNGGGRFYLSGRLFSELIPMLLLMGIIIGIALLRKMTIAFDYFIKQHAWLFVTLGLCASLPLMITLEQRGFYLVTSLPYFAIAAALLIAKPLSSLLNQININAIPFTIFRTVAPFVLISVLLISAMHTGGYNRDQETIKDIHRIGKIVPKGTIVGASSALWSQWSFQEYLIRHYYICISNSINESDEYVILENGENAPANIPLEKIQIATTRYHLYKTIR